MGSKPSAKIGGLRWQPTDTIQSIGVGSLQAKILCEGHNSDLSPLDSEAARLFKLLHAVDKERASVPSLSSVDGPSVERWLLKVLFGLSASRSSKAPLPPDKWKSLLTGAAWPSGWGLYVFHPAGPQIFSSDLLIETRINPATSEILVGVFRVAGVAFNLLLGTPDSPAAFGTHRPRGLIFHHGTEERRIEFLWPFHTEKAVIYTNVGTTPKKPDYYEGWAEG